MKWKLERIDWHSHGLCWSWLKIHKGVYYSGNQVQWVWGRIAFVFERRTWNFHNHEQHPEMKMQPVLRISWHKEGVTNITSLEFSMQECKELNEENRNEKSYYRYYYIS